MKSKDILRGFFTKKKEVVISKKKDILYPDEEIKDIYYIKKGFVRSYSINQDGSEITLNIYKPGSFFPLTLAVSGKKNPNYFQTMTNVILHKAKFVDVWNFVSGDINLLSDLVKRLSSGIEGFMIRTQFLLRSSADEKIASNLSLLTKRFGTKSKSGSIKIELPLTHQDIADMSGLSRETTSIILKKLEKANILYKNGKNIIIKSPNKLFKKTQLNVGDKNISNFF
jgi:CRP/FNR family transcriptional regulator